MPQMNKFAPNQADAPEPSRSIQAHPDSVYSEYPLPPSSFAEAEPPTDPAAAVQELEESQKTGELIAALGRQREEYEAKLEEMRLQIQLMQHQPAQPQTFSPDPSQLPPDYDPKAYATNGQILEALYRFGEQVSKELEATRLRSRWDVTDEEEAAALSIYPAINQKQEPDRSKAILDAVRVLRKSRGATAKSTAGTPAHSNVPTAPRTVPSPSVAPTTVADQRPVSTSDSLKKAFADYEAAKRLPNKSQRVAAMKEAHSRILQLQSTSREAVSQAGFRMK